MKRAELLRSEGYWIAKLQTDLYRELVAYMEKTHMNSSQLAKHLGCSKGYVSQLLNGNFGHKISKLVELSLAIGKAPILEYKDVSKYILENDETFSSVQMSSISNSQYKPVKHKAAYSSFVLEYDTIYTLSYFSY